MRKPNDFFDRIWKYILSTKAKRSWLEVRTKVKNLKCRFSKQIFLHNSYNQIWIFGPDFSLSIFENSNFVLF